MQRFGIQQASRPTILDNIHCPTSSNMRDLMETVSLRLYYYLLQDCPCIVTIANELVLQRTVHGRVRQVTSNQNNAQDPPTTNLYS